ncbi:MAG: efflux RND transporter periplasmic adaptor subunit [Segetibacter sp.]|nr:efflux RND transporter periplasmic adaptor subunit [Segetibacter sp.]
MQSFIKLFFISIFAILIVSCGAGKKEKDGALNDQKSKLEKLKKQQADLNAEIKKLQADISKVDTANGNAEKGKLVVLDTVRVANFTHYIDLQGKVDAENTSYISPRGMGGQVRAVYVKQGQVVRKGQLLLKLDDAIVRQNVAAAKQGMEATKAQLALAKSVYERYKNLWDQNIGSEVQLMQYKTNVDALQANLRTQQESVKLAQEQLATTNVVSNVNGVADEVNIHAGETFTGAPTMGIKIVNTRNLKVVTNIPENYLARVSKGTPVIVTIPDVNKTYKSSISLISQAIGTLSRGFIAEAKIPSDKNVKPNLTASIKIQDYTKSNAITVPINTLQTDERGKFVLIAVKEGDKMVARKREIAVGELYGDKLEVKSGLQGGDIIITEGFQSLYDGQLVSVAA